MGVVMVPVVRGGSPEPLPLFRIVDIQFLLCGLVLFSRVMAVLT